MPEDAAKRTAVCVVVDFRVSVQMSGMPELIEGHARLAFDGDVSHFCLDTGDDVESDVDELLFRMPFQGVSDLRFVEAIVGKSLPHAALSRAEAILREAGTGIETAGCNELRIHG